MMPNEIGITYVGGPTALLEFAGLRFLTDPTFDAAGSEYKSGPATLHKTGGPALNPEQLGPVDYVLLSHDHHSDNLDHTGRAVLPSARRVFTTVAGAERLGGNSLGLEPWQSATIPMASGGTVRVIATPARHGPEGIDRGPVVGFVLTVEDAPETAIYVAGDTVWYQGVAEVASRFSIQAAILNLGAACVPEVGPFHLTMTAADALESVRHLSHAVIVPLHFEDWAHFSEGREQIAKAFAAAGCEDRLRWPERGRKVLVTIGETTRFRKVS